MSDKYILDAHNACVPVDLLTWARWFEVNDARRIVAKTQVGEAEVSTVFIGLDHSFGRGPLELFETMIFDGPLEGYERRYATWAQAELGHAETVAMLAAAPSTVGRALPDAEARDPQGASGPRGATSGGEALAIKRALLPLLVSYECDEPHGDAEDSGYFPSIAYEQIVADMASEHHGDCTHEPQPCLRCHAESWNHKATWLATRLAAALARPEAATPLHEAVAQRDAVSGISGGADQAGAPGAASPTPEAATPDARERAREIVQAFIVVDMETGHGLSGGEIERFTNRVAAALASPPEAKG